MDFSGLVFLITGASRGIGKTVANIIHNYGGTVVGIYNHTKITNVLYDTYKCDISNEEEIKKLFEYIKDKHESLDVLINCAALEIDNNIEDKTKEEFMKVLEVNVVGTFLMCKYASKMMKKGVIVNVSSTNGIDTYNPLSIDYDASKAAIINLTKNLALHLSNLKVCCIAPNWVDTESVKEMQEEYLKEELYRIGQKRLLTKEEVALKIIEIIINDDICTGEVIRLDDKDE